MDLELAEILLGLMADSLIFAGGFVLARDAQKRLEELSKLKELQKKQQAFSFKSTDPELFQAAETVARARLGTILMTCGFFLQLILHSISAVRWLRQGGELR